MNYTIKKDDIIFELPLYPYLGTRRIRSYNKETKSYGEWHIENINTMQGYEEYIFETFDCDYDIAEDLDDIYSFNKNDNESYKYLKFEGYFKKEIELFQDVLFNDYRRALNDAYNNSYQSEWFNKFMEMTQEKIDDDLDDNIPELNFKLLDRLTDANYFSKRSDKDHLRLKISKKDLKAYMKKNKDDYGHDALYSEKNDFIDFFVDYALDFNCSPINTKYVDYHGTMGNSDDWLECFKDCNEIENTIINHRKAEKLKVNSIKELSTYAIPKINDIINYTNNYINNKTINTKIIRQLKSISSLLNKLQ